MLRLLLVGLIAIIFPPFCVLVLAQLVGIPGRDIPVFVLYALGIGPAILAWIVDVLFHVTPGMPIRFYTCILSREGEVCTLPTDFWRCSLRRRSQKDRTTWNRIKKLADDFLPQDRILHSWPHARLAVTPKVGAECLNRAGSDLRGGAYK